MSEVIKVDFANRRPSNPKLKGRIVIHQFMQIDDFRGTLTDRATQALVDYHEALEGSHDHDPFTDPKVLEIEQVKKQLLNRLDDKGRYQAVLDAGQILDSREPGPSIA